MQCDKIDRTPSRKTLRRYFFKSKLTDDELYFYAKWFALHTQTDFVKPGQNKFFPAFLHFAELHKISLLKIKNNVDKHDEEQCWEDHDCLNEIVKEIDILLSESSCFDDFKSD